MLTALNKTSKTYRLMNTDLIHERLQMFLRLSSEFLFVFNQSEFNHLKLNIQTLRSIIFHPEKIEKNKFWY